MQLHLPEGEWEEIGSPRAQDGRQQSMELSKQGARRSKGERGRGCGEGEGQGKGEGEGLQQSIWAEDEVGFEEGGDDELIPAHRPSEVQKPE